MQVDEGEDQQLRAILAGLDIQSRAVDQLEQQAIVYVGLL